MGTKKSALNKLTKKNPELEIEVYHGIFKDIDNIERLHTDNCQFVDFSIKDLKEKDILDFGIVSAEDYNKTIYANCSETQEESVIVVAVTRR